jgi:L-lactate dehydrogenase complex protein LldG
MSDSANKVIDDVRRALGRAEPLREKPTPPAIDEPITRLVHSDIGLPGLFIKRAVENKMEVESVRVEELGEKLVAYLRSRNIKSVAMPVSPFLSRIGAMDALRQSGLIIGSWEKITVDELFDFDCGLTDVYAAVAETGSIVIKGSPEHGRALSLVPPVHVAIVEPKNIVADLVDFFEKLTIDGAGAGTSIISGPSKTADIEMNLVQGVHGPGTVKVFVLE